MADPDRPVEPRWRKTGTLPHRGSTNELDGYSIHDWKSSKKKASGIEIRAPNARIFNGRVLEGGGLKVRGSGGKGDDAEAYHHGGAIGSQYRTDGLEVAGIYTDVHRPTSYPLKLFGSVKRRVDIHYNHVASRVTRLWSRHYPGNDIMRIDMGDSGTADVSVHHNPLTEGSHRAITTYKQTRFGGHGDSGQWAAAMFFVGMDKSGPAKKGKNRFKGMKP